MKKRTVLIVALIAFFAVKPALSKSKTILKVEGQAKFYKLSNELYKEVYGSGSVMPAISLAFGNNHYEVRAETGLFNKTGAMTKSKESVKLRINPITIGARIKFLKTKLRPYIGAGVGLYLYKETLPARFESVSDSTMGFHGEGGFCFALSRKIDIDLNFRLYLGKITSVRL